jgi:hypothetical protein
VGKLNRGRDYLRVGGRRGLYQSRSGLPKSRRPARIVSEVGTIKWWVSKVAKEDSDCLGSQDLAPYQGSMDRKVRPIVQQGFDLLWVQVTTSVECTKIIKILPITGRSYERGKKGSHRSSNQPVKTDEHSSFE